MLDGDKQTVTVVKLSADAK